MSTVTCLRIRKAEIGMEMFLRLLTVALTAAFTENLIFTRAVGWGETDYRSFSSKRLPFSALIVTVICVTAAFSGWLAKYLMEKFYSMAVHLRPPIYLIVYSVLIFCFILVIHRIPAQKKQQMLLNPVLAFGFIPLSVMLIVGMGSYSLGESLVYGLGGGLGYLGAVLLSASMKSYLELRKVPESMQGAPVALLYFGLVSLAIFGALGHQVAF